MQTLQKPFHSLEPSNIIDGVMGILRRGTWLASLDKVPLQRAKSAFSSYTIVPRSGASPGNPPNPARFVRVRNAAALLDLQPHTQSPLEKVPQGLPDMPLRSTTASLALRAARPGVVAPPFSPAAPHFRQSLPPSFLPRRARSRS